jgi:hypothetical protein
MKQGLMDQLKIGYVALHGEAPLAKMGMHVKP